MPTDGRFVYAMYGSLAITTPNVIIKYTLDGRLVSQSNEILVGKANSASLSSGTSNEWEGAQFVQLYQNTPPVLTVGYLQGGPTYYKRVWAFGVNANPNPGRCVLSLGNTPQTLSTTGFTKMLFNTKSLDNLKINVDTANNRIIPGVGEVYSFDLKAKLSSLTLGAAGLIRINIRKNGDVTHVAESLTYPEATTDNIVPLQYDTDVGNGVDYYEIFISTATSGAIIDGSNRFTRLSIEQKL